MPLSENLVDVIQLIGETIRGDRDAMGDLTQLATTDKTSLVAAINEIKNSSGGGGSSIDDDVISTSTTWSSAKIDTEITTAIAALIDGAPETLNTLNKLAVALSENTGEIATIIDLINTKVDATDIGDTNPDLVGTFNTALAGS